MKATVEEDTEKAWETGKFGMRVDFNWRGETAETDRKGYADISFEYRGAGARNMLNIRLNVHKSPAFNFKDTIMCFKAESTFQAAPGDVIDISSYTEPPTAQGTIEFVMGETNQPNQVVKIQYVIKCTHYVFTVGWSKFFLFSKSLPSQKV